MKWSRICEFEDRSETIINMPFAMSGKGAVETARMIDGGIEDLVHVDKEINGDDNE